MGANFCCRHRVRAIYGIEHHNNNFNSCGIPEEAFETIFEDFKQVDGSLSREVGGTGLGLSISRRIMELHGGTITVESEVGVGSKFTLMLPQTLVVGNSSVPPVSLNL